MNNIRIVFERDSGLFPRLIRWLTNSDVNHVAISYKSEDWQADWIAEAVPKGVRAIPDRNRKWRHVFSVKYDATGDVILSQRYIGENYDFEGFFIFGWILLCWKILRRRIRRPLHATKGILCSEFIGHILRQKLPELPDPQWTTPQDLLKVCVEHKEFFTEESVVA